MLLLAGVLGANLASMVRPCHVSIKLGRSSPPFWVDTNVWHWTKVGYGWPFECVTRLVFDIDKALVTWKWPALAADIGIGLAIPIAGLLACEFVLRRWGKKAKT